MEHTFIRIQPFLVKKILYLQNQLMPLSFWFWSDMCKSLDYKRAWLLKHESKWENQSTAWHGTTWMWILIWLDHFALFSSLRTHTHARAHTHTHWHTHAHACVHKHMHKAKNTQNSSQRRNWSICTILFLKEMHDWYVMLSFSRRYCTNIHLFNRLHKFQR